MTRPVHAGVEYAVRPPIQERELEVLFAEEWGPGSATGYDRVLERSLCYLGAYLETELVGFVNVGWDGGAHAFILDIIVKRGLRRGGIGLELVKRAVALARDHGVEWIHVDYKPHLDGFYAKAGFHATMARLLHFPRSTAW